MSGFTGIFCENKHESDFLLFLIDNNAMIYNVTEDKSRKLIAHDLQINSAFQPVYPRIYQSCSTVFKGLSLIFGGSRAPRQVYLLSLTNNLITKNPWNPLFRFVLLLIAEFTISVNYPLIYEEALAEHTM